MPRYRNFHSGGFALGFVLILMEKSVKNQAEFCKEREREEREGREKEREGERERDMPVQMCSSDYINLP